MLKRDHILHLKIDRMRLMAQQDITTAGQNGNCSNARVEALGNAVVGSILDIEPEAFKAELNAARSKRVSYLVNSIRGVIGVSPAISVVKDNRILNKNLIIPRWRTTLDPGLADHWLVAVFVHARRAPDGAIEYDPDSVKVAGWTDVRRLVSCGTNRLPDKFETGLQVTVMPCRYLEPIDTLIRQLADTKGAGDGKTV